MRRAAVALLLAAAACGDPATEETWLPVVHDDLILEVDVTGSLRATRTTPIGPPSLSEMRDFKIVKMAAESAELKQGEPVLTFDASDLERQLAERSSERDTAAQEIVKRRIEHDLARREGEIRVAEAEAAMRKAALKADLPPQYTAAVEVKLAKIDLEAASAELAGARSRLHHERGLGEAELAYLKDRHARHAGRVERIEDTIAKMTVGAPTNGVVAYPVNWRGDKKKVGDSCWPGEVCVEVVDVSEMTARGEVDESEAAQVQIGQRVAFRLDALPEIEWSATVREIRPNVYRQSPRNPLKVIGIDLEIERTDRSRMRPGMQLRGRVETGRVPKATLVPLDAVFGRPDGPVAFRRAPVGHEKVKLRLGRRNARAAEVLHGLAAGDRVARRDLDREAVP